MCKDNKYYTPKISEIGIGFELEMVLPQWLPQEFRPTFIDTTFQLDVVDDLIKQERVRVKYLDRTDIESLGFVYTTHFDNDDEIYRLPDSKAVILYNGHATHRYLVISGPKRFDGKIKNKSELKKVLDMIGVEYEQQKDS